MILALLIFNIAFWLYSGPTLSRRAGPRRKKETKAQHSKRGRERESARARGREQGRSGGRACLLRASGVWMRAQLDREAYKTDGDIKLLSNERLWVVF
jgi:hypothetical protein